MYLAKLIGPDGYEETKQFSTGQAARAWLDDEGLKTFDGDIERAELYSGGEMVWSKLRPRLIIGERMELGALGTSKRNE